jgi:hypothetical protein
VKSRASSSFPLIAGARRAGIAVGRPELLRHHPFAPERAGVLEEDRAIADVVLVESDALLGRLRSLSREAFSVLDGSASQVLDHGAGRRRSSNTNCPFSSTTMVSPSIVQTIFGKRQPPRSEADKKGRGLVCNPRQVLACVCCSSGSLLSRRSVRSQLLLNP